MTSASSYVSASQRIGAAQIKARTNVFAAVAVTSDRSLKCAVSDDAAADLSLKVYPSMEKAMMADECLLSVEKAIDAVSDLACITPLQEVQNTIRMDFYAQGLKALLEAKSASDLADQLEHCSVAARYAFLSLCPSPCLVSAIFDVEPSTDAALQSLNPKFGNLWRKLSWEEKEERQRQANEMFAAQEEAAALKRVDSYLNSDTSDLNDQVRLQEETTLLKGLILFFRQLFHKREDNQ